MEEISVRQINTVCLCEGLGLVYQFPHAVQLMPPHWWVILRFHPSTGSYQSHIANLRYMSQIVTHKDANFFLMTVRYCSCMEKVATQHSLLEALLAQIKADAANTAAPSATPRLWWPGEGARRCS